MKSRRRTFATGATAGGRKYTKSYKPREVVISPRGTGGRYKGAIKGPGITYVTPKTPANYTKVSHANATKFMHSSPKEFERAAPRIAALQQSHSIRDGKYSFENVTAPTQGNGSNKSIPLMSHNSVTTAPGSSIYSAKATKRTNIVTGRPTSSTLKMISRLNGTIKEVAYDTKSQASLITPQITYEQLNQNCGFNSRSLYWFPPKAYITADDVMFSARTTIIANEPGEQDVRYYASILESESQFQFYNQSADFPVKLKFHLIAPKGDSSKGTNSTAEEVQFSVFNTNLITQTRGAIPIQYQHSVAFLEVGSVIANDTIGMKVDLSLKGSGLNASPYFRETFDIAKTFSMTLLPGETWQVSHKHHLGAGYDLSRAVDQTTIGVQEARYQPVAYYYAMEMKGVPCEALYKYDTTPAPVAALGTSPGYVDMAWRKSMKYVAASTRADQFTLTGTPNAMHMRIFKTDENANNLNKELFVLPENIVFTASNIPTVPGTATIPVATQVFTRAMKTAGAGAEDPLQ